ncbi:Ribonuclease H [Abeliophyllum distichum]|uniref:Ribonuclease H n=1 Tax=Abeliophyllum distichum TaxID=126358 RepID=A0ABD1UM46_9LAMI
MIAVIAQLNDIRQKEEKTVKSYFKKFSNVINKIETVTDEKALDALENEAGIHYPHCDALVVRAVVARNGRILVDDRSAVNIVFSSAFDQMDVDHELTAISEPLFSFTGNSRIPRGRITLAVDFGKPSCHLRKFMKFLIVDTRFANHGVLGRPALKDLQAVTNKYNFVLI